MVDHAPGSAGAHLTGPMAAMQTETIAAIATAHAPGAVGIVRVSGPGTRAIAAALLGKCPPPRTAVFRRFLDAVGTIDEGLALFFPGPASYTGEDVLELQGHGGPIVLDLLLRRTVQLGARLARPGEFSERAFLNGKMDLVQAEAVADLIQSRSEAAARGAVRALQGAFSTAVNALIEQLIRLRLLVEASIDFSDETGGLDRDPLEHDLTELVAGLSQLRAHAGQGRLLNDGLRVVLVGAPNTGKSSLLNALAGDEAAIVHAQAGTTRDILRVSIMIQGLAVELVDTAGLRNTEDEVEQEGVRRARRAAQEADLLLILVDDRDPRPPAALPDTAALWVHNKIDLTGRSPGSHGPDRLAVSVLRDQGLEVLKEAIIAKAGFSADTGGTFSARRRHVEALARAEGILQEGARAYETHRAAELLAEDLRRAQGALEEIGGKFGAEELLGRIFSTFCIGK